MRITEYDKNRQISACFLLHKLIYRFAEVLDGGLISGGMVESVGRYWIPALTLYFAATVLMILLAAVSHLYSLGICRAHSDGMTRIRRELAAEYLRMFLILSGGVFILGCTAVLLI